MIAHILGKNSNNPCPNTSEEVQRVARVEKKGKKKKREWKGEGSSNENDGQKKRVRGKLLTNVEVTLKQSHLKVF
jgi:hypothetical protein